jgi:hypothetical protein
MPPSSILKWGRNHPTYSTYCNSGKARAHIVPTMSTQEVGDIFWPDLRLCLAEGHFRQHADRLFLGGTEVNSHCVEEQLCIFDHFCIYAYLLSYYVFIYIYVCVWISRELANVGLARVPWLSTLLKAESHKVHYWLQNVYDICMYIYIHIYVTGTFRGLGFASLQFLSASSTQLCKIVHGEVSPTSCKGAPRFTFQANQVHPFERDHREMKNATRHVSSFQTPC